jgi:hypothetical protein
LYHYDESLARQCGVRHSTVIGNGQMLGVTPLRNSQQHGTMGRVGTFHVIVQSKHIQLMTGRYVPCNQSDTRE